MTDSTEEIVLPGFAFDATHGELRDAHGALVTLRPQCVRLMQRLARDLGHVVPKDVLVKAVWADVVVTDDSLVQCVGHLRRALDDGAHAIVQTEARRGYRLVGTRRARTGGRVPASLPEHVLDAAHAAPGYRQHVRFATTADGVRLAWAEAGQGTPLLRAGHWMTHVDFDWQSAAFGGRVQAFARRHRFLRYDARGSGLSDRNVDPGDLDSQASDMLAVADAAGVRRFVAVGISGGAPVAVRVAARAPERVHRLLLLGGFPYGELHTGRAGIGELVDATARVIEHGWGHENPSVRLMVVANIFPDATADQLRAICEMQRLACSGAQAAKMLRARAAFDVRPDLPRVRCPTLVAHSRGDAGPPLAAGRALAAGIAGARFEVIESRNHMPLVGEPAFARLTELVDAFVDEDPLIDRPHAPALRVVDGRSG